MNEMKKKRGRPALGRTRKLTKGVTVKFSPVSYEALRFRARKSGRSLAVYIREVAAVVVQTWLKQVVKIQPVLIWQLKRQKRFWKASYNFVLFQK